MYTVKENYVNVVGKGWYSQPIALSIKLRQYDIDNMRGRVSDNAITREDIESWLDCNAGDFQSIKDFYALVDNEGVEIPWNSEDNEIEFFDMTDPIYD